MEKTIFFDMDGTLADFYGIDNWLEYLNNFDVTPYKQADTLFNMSAFARLLHKVQNMGYKIGIISWLSMTGTKEYNERVTQVKLDWLKLHLPSVEWDIIHITEYGVSKNSFMNTTDDVLFDDNAEIRQEWGANAFDEKNILDILKSL
jgi:FMN phosphatase YigB (HAD superfamily)